MKKKRESKEVDPLSLAGAKENAADVFLDQLGKEDFAWSEPQKYMKVPEKLTDAVKRQDWINAWVSEWNEQNRLQVEAAHILT